MLLVPILCPLVPLNLARLTHSFIYRKLDPWHHSLIPHSLHSKRRSRNLFSMAVPEKCPNIAFPKRKSLENHWITLWSQNPICSSLKHSPDKGWIFCPRDVIHQHRKNVADTGIVAMEADLKITSQKTGWFQQECKLYDLVSFFPALSEGVVKTPTSEHAHQILSWPWMKKCQDNSGEMQTLIKFLWPIRGDIPYWGFQCHCSTLEADSSTISTTRLDAATCEARCKLCCF